MSDPHRRPDLRHAMSAATGEASPAASDGVATIAFDDRIIEAELRHRFGNLIAVVQSLVVQTVHDGASPAEARHVLVDRLGAMNAAVDLLVRRHWQAGSLRDTVCDGLVRRLGYGERIECEGPDLAIGGGAVMALTLALHELTTNAIKYGALSVPQGSVWLFWKLVGTGPDRRLWMQWCERGGPPVRQPDRLGFGSRLICGAVGRALGGETDLQFTPGGVTWLLVAPLDRIGG